MQTHFGRFFQLTGVSLMLAGVFVLSLPYLPMAFPVHPRAAVHIAESTDNNREHSQSYPIRIIIPSVELSVPLFAVPYTDERWAIPTGGAALVTNPQTLGATDKRIIYGHNWKSIFKSITKTKAGDILALEYPDGSKQLFSVVTTTETTPDNLSILSTGEPGTVHVYTCSGMLDSKRYVVSARPLFDQKNN